ncbi:Bgt-20242 [Blumeria graminis f. sp. tritici]|uniref:Bgt-20242 n=2 Tax=Blumeria graminis f. sp. tritici TaxID=62690 RepID=A0A381L9I5_BLUGR|nr:Bgt-20242 [Blumeria graminis f. sp. tritici]
MKATKASHHPKHTVHNRLKNNSQRLTRSPGDEWISPSAFFCTDRFFLYKAGFHMRIPKGWVSLIACCLSFKVKLSVSLRLSSISSSFSASSVFSASSAEKDLCLSVLSWASGASSSTPVSAPVTIAASVSLSSASSSSLEATLASVGNCCALWRLLSVDGCCLLTLKLKLLCPSPLLLARSS